MLFLLFFILLGLGTVIFIHYRKLNQANKLYTQARELEKKDTRSPYDITKLNQALALYKQCNQLVNHPTYLKAANQCKQKIDERKRFQNLLAIGRKNARERLFKEALEDFLKAKRLFVTKELEDEISKCQESIKQQEKYEKVLEQSTQIAKQGQFEEAINLLKPALNEFYREDGQQLLAKLERIIQAKELYNFGLIAEKTNKLKDAIAKYEQTLYEQALNLLPEFIECKIRLGIVTAKENPNKAISYLEGIEGQKAAYIRGFAHAHLGNWQQANREWKSIHDDAVDSQREIVRCLAERDRLMRIREIEKQIDKGCPLLAKSASLKFIEKFGSDPIVQTNLEEHIQPSLENQIWNTKDWGVISTKTEQIWLEKQDITSLHNWAIATYYQAQTDSNKLADFIIAWSTALANIEINPALKNVPWLGSTSIDLNEVSSKLKQMLENAIDAVKDNDINEYLRLRDIYRRDMVSLSHGNNLSIPVGERVNRMFIPPGCYQRHQNKLTIVTFSVENLHSKSTQAALYTDWGLAVAACLEKDTARAIQIKPVKHPSSQADCFAYSFVSYHEGCYHLQNLEWRKAINPLQQAKAEIKAEFDWCKEIDRLCELQRQKLDNFDEHLQFSQFWYELLNSQPGRSYFAECKARTVAHKLDDKKITLQQGLDELQKVRNIDPSNSVTLNLIEKVEINLELEKINRLWEQSQFEEAVILAKRSRHESIRFMVAEICIDILLKGAENRSLSFELMHQLGQWAYELCPREPAFMPLYSELGIYR